MTHWLGVVAAVLVPAAPEDAGKIAYVATVKVPEAEVRSGAGASDQLYSTNRLHKGDKVEVVKELEGGWLAIKPPAGSFSWINARFVQPLDAAKKTWVVVAHPEARVPLLLGSNIRTTKPTVEGASVVRGTQLLSIGPMKSADDGRWLPVEPPPTEVRYIRAEAVARAGTGDAAPPAAAPVTADKGSGGRVVAKPADPAQPRPAATIPPPAALPAGWVSSGPGRLEAAGRCIAYQRTYVLLNSRGWPVVYVVAPKGWSLESYLKRNLEVFGVRQHSQELRADYITAMQVKLLP